MIQVISRFKVVNGLERAVRDAFINRPHLVDHEPGFLGMEVFTEKEDACAFYLITRWTNLDAYKQWHRSPAHHQSHRGIPKGLKVDPTFTRIITLEPLADHVAPDRENKVHSDSGDFFDQFISSSNLVFYIKAKLNGELITCNRALLKLLKSPSSEVCGKSLWNYLAASDTQMLRERLANAACETQERFLLNVVDTEHVPHTLECSLQLRGSYFVILGELNSGNSNVNEQFIELNNQLAVMTRESERRNKALEQSRAELKKALENLESSYWHIRKMQEVIPFCLVCGKIKAEEAGWEAIAEYLARNKLLLSHGYCPDCFEQVKHKYGITD